MKINLTILILLFLSTNLIKGQDKSVSLKWFHNASDTTLKEKERTYWGLPRAIFESRSKDVFLVTQHFFGWTVDKLNLKTGQPIWRATRNQDFPDSTRKMFIFSNIFERKDGKLEVLGAKSYFDDLGIPILFGNPIKAVYDNKNGKEISTLSPIQPTKKNSTYESPTALRGFIKDGDNYLWLSFTDENIKDSIMYLRTLDTNLIIRDTLSWHKKYKTPIFNKATLQKASSPNKINNHFYQLFYYFQYNLDTLGHRHLFTKTDLKGKVLVEKNISKDIYYRVNDLRQTEASDGFLVSWGVDTSYKSQKFKGLVAKFDTLGNLQWRVILQHPENKKNEIVHVCEDIYRKSYWAVAGSSKDSTISLYHIDLRGKFKFVADILVPNNTESFLPANIWPLSNGDLIISLRYHKCDSPGFIYCWGAGLLESEKLDYLLSDKLKESVVESSVFVYPNPADKQITIKVSTPNTGNYVVINQLGQIFNSGTINTDNIVVNTNSFPNGAYFIKIETEPGKISTTRFIVQH